MPASSTGHDDECGDLRMGHAVVSDGAPTAGGLPYNHRAYMADEGQVRRIVDDGIDVSRRLQSSSHIIGSRAAAGVLCPGAAGFAIPATQGEGHYVAAAQKPLSGLLLAATDPHL